MAYFYHDDWNDYPPDYEKWKEESKEHREYGSEFLVTEESLACVDSAGKVISAAGKQMGLTLAERFYKEGKALPRTIEVFQERDVSLRAWENSVTAAPKPLGDSQQYLYLAYCGWLAEKAKVFEWETKPTRTKHHDWAVNTKEYKQLEDKYNALLEQFVPEGEDLLPL